jgi:hypothetical protein
MPIRLPMHPDKELHLVGVKANGSLDALTTNTPMLPGFAEFFEVDYG